MADRDIVDIPVEFSHLPSGLKQVHEVWTQARGNAIGPSRKSFDLMAIPTSLIPFASLTDYHADSGTFIVRFFGTGLVDIDGVEMTGKNLMETPHSGLRECLCRLFRRVVDEKQENFAEFRYKSALGLHRLSKAGRWPLSDNGETVSGILSVVQPLETTRNLHDIFGEP